MQERRLAFFVGRHCLLCGTEDQLELDRIDPEAPANHRIWSYSDERRAQELAKYQVLCHDCRMIRRRRWREHNIRHCPNGHEYTEANTKYAPTGSRYCRTCHNEGEQRRKLRKPKPPL